MHGFELILSASIDYDNIVSDSPERNQIFNGVHMTKAINKKYSHAGLFKTPQKKYRCVCYLVGATLNASTQREFKVERKYAQARVFAGVLDEQRNIMVRNRKQIPIQAQQQRRLHQVD